MYNTINEYEYEALYYACEHNDVETVRLLLTSCKVFNPECDDYLLFDLVARLGHLDVLMLLFQYNRYPITYQQFSSFIMKACENDHVHIVDYILTSHNISVPEHNIFNRRMFNNAVINGNLNIIRYMLTTQSSQWNHTLDNFDHALKLACEYGRLNIVSYLLTSPDLTEHPDIHSNEGAPLQYACANGHLNVVSYLLTSPDLKEHADIHQLSDLALRIASEEDHLDTVSYLMTSPELKEHADISAHEYEAFTVACQRSHSDIVSFFLSLPRASTIPFQSLSCNLEWAMDAQHHDIVYAMILHLYEHDKQTFDQYFNSIFFYFVEHSPTHHALLQKFCDDKVLNFNMEITPLIH